MYSGLENYNRSGYEGVTETWDWVQADLGCCGVANSTDWDGVGLPIPASCCPASTANTTTGELVNPAQRARSHAPFVRLLLPAQPGPLHPGLPPRHGGHLRGQLRLHRGGHPRPRGVRAARDHPLLLPGRQDQQDEKLPTPPLTCGLTVNYLPFIYTLKYILYI